MIIFSISIIFPIDIFVSNLYFSIDFFTNTFFLLLYLLFWFLS